MDALVVSTPGTRIYLRRGVVYAKPPDGPPVPVTADTEAVVLATGAVSVSGRALRRLAELGVRLIVLGHRGHVAAEARPVDRVNKSTVARLAQLRAKLSGEALRHAAAMVEAKIVNQARLLRRLAKSRREPWLREASYRVEEHAARLQRLLESPRPPGEEQLRAAEAAAARHYWQSIAQLLPGGTGFKGRDPRADDPVNKALSYGYAILYSLAYDALLVAGLDPYPGFLHHDRSGQPSLVYDYSDTFKPVAVDKALVTAASPELFETSHGALAYTARREIARRILGNLASAYTDNQGHKRSLRDHVYSYAWRLSETLRRGGTYAAFKARL